jgi:hypothetical protein
MSDPNDPIGGNARLPVDEAYAEAEAMLRDDNAQAARRARLLAAVAAQAPPETQAEPARASAPVASSLPPPRRGAWKPAPWLAAAGVAGIAALVSFRITPPATVRPPQIAPIAKLPAPEAPVVADAAASPATTTEHAPARLSAPAAPPPPKLQPRPPMTLPDAPSIPPLPVPPVERRIEQPTPSIPPLPVPPVERRLPASEVAVAPGAPAEMTSGGQRAAAAANSKATGDSARLAAAAIAGNTTEIRRLTEIGVPIDVTDNTGETALMKAVRANRPAAVALLRRAGADLDHRNRAGVSARDLAAAMGDQSMNRALGIEP